MFLLVQYFCVYKNTTNFPNFQIIFIVIYNYILYICEKDIFYYKVFYNKTIMENKKEYNQYLWAPEQPRVYETSPLAISGTPMSEEDAAMSLKVENLQQSLQQNPIFKSAKQWEEQQKQREKEIAASKKWLELHPEDDNDDPYTILERGKHQAIVDGKDPSYYEKMIDDGKQFTKGALSVLSLPYLGAAAAGAYGYGASLGARGLFAGQGIYGLANENGVRKTVNLIKSGNYGRAALSGAGDALNAAMVLPGAKFLGNVAKYGLKSTAAGEVLGQNVRYAPQIGGRLIVNQDYFKDPTKFYRIGTTPEKLSIEYAGENVVSGSAKDLGKVTPADSFRRTVTGNSRIQPGKGVNEGYWVLAPEQSNTKIIDLIQKVNSSHGGETQASAGTLWKGGLNSDSRFPTVIFEGTMPKTIGASWNSTLGKSLGRSTFVRQPSENLPIGTRLGFKTGEMPIHSTNYFTETSPGSGKFFYNGEIIPENRIPVGAYRQSPEQMAEKINQLNTKGFTVLGHGTGFGGQEAAKNIEREGLKIFKRSGTGLVEDADITNTASFLGGPDTATKLSNWPHLNSRYISLFPSSEFRYVNGDRRYFDLFPKGTFEYVPEKSGKSLLDYEPGGWSVVKGKGGATKPSSSMGYYDSKEGIFYPNSNYQYKSYNPKSNERTYLGLLERPSKLSEAELKGVPKSVRNFVPSDNEPFRKQLIDTYNGWIKQFNQPIADQNKRAQEYADYWNSIGVETSPPFASEIPYESIPDNATIPEAKRIIENTMRRHNQFYRGVSKPILDEDLSLVKGLSDEEALIRATQPRPGDGIWITPASNAFTYGSYGKTALLRRPYKLGKNPMNWIKEGDFKIRGYRPEESTKYGIPKPDTIYDPWHTPNNPAQGHLTELWSTQPLKFIEWRERPNVEETSLNWMTYKQGGILKRK